MSIFFVLFSLAWGVWFSRA